MLKNHKALVTVYIDGVACSIATVIAMAGNKIIMPSNSMMMIHNPVAGDAFSNLKYKIRAYLRADVQTIHEPHFIILDDIK